MATPVNRSQQVTTLGLSPASAYSRVVAIRADCALGVGARTSEHTESFGQALRLLRVDVWLYTTGLDSPIDGWFALMTGLETAPSAVEMLRGWEHIIPNHRGDVNAFIWLGFREHFWWDMCKLYKTVPRRFGVVLHNFSAAAGFSAIVTFKVSEG